MPNVMNHKSSDSGFGISASSGHTSGEDFLSKIEKEDVKNKIE